MAGPQRTILRGRGALLSRQTEAEPETPREPRALPAPDMPEGRELSTMDRRLHQLVAAVYPGGSALGYDTRQVGSEQRRSGGHPGFFSKFAPCILELRSIHRTVHVLDLLTIMPPKLFFDLGVRNRPTFIKALPRQR